MLDVKNTKAEIPSLESQHYLLFNKSFDNISTGDAIRFIIERNLMDKDKPKQIKMIINSEGGDLTSCFALIDTMKGSKVPIYTYGLGQIASCGLLTFIAGRKGNRYITKNTSILSHQFSWFNIGKEHELMAQVKEYNNTAERILNHYKRCTGLSERDIRKYLLPAEDVWLTAEEAVDLGLADDVVEFY